MLHLEFRLAATTVEMLLAAVLSGYQLAKLCPGGAEQRLAWGFVLGNALFVVALWNLSWFGFPIERVAWVVVGGLPLLNVLIEALFFRNFGAPNGLRAAIRNPRSFFFGLAVAVAILWQIIPLVMSGSVGAVLYDAPEFPTNTGLAEWLATHSLRGDFFSLPADSSSWGAFRHISMHLRVGQHMYHALLISLSGQSAVATWPLMGAMAVAIQSVAAFLLAMYATRGRFGWSAAIALLMAAHPLMHSASQTTFISMATGMAFLAAASTLLFATAEEKATLGLALPLGICVLALFLSYQEILPAFAIMAVFFGALSLWASRADRARLAFLCGVAGLAVAVTVALSPMGVWWSVTGLFRQAQSSAHGAPPVLAPEMMLSLITGLAQLPGDWTQLNRGAVDTFIRWSAILVLVGGLLLSLTPRARLRAVAAILASSALLFGMVLRRGGPPDLLHYGLSRTILYPAGLIFVFGLAGWSRLATRHKFWATAVLGGYAVAFLGFSPHYFQNIFSDPYSLTIPAISGEPKWLRQVPPRTNLLFETDNKDQVAFEAPFWHWLQGRTSSDTFLNPVMLMSVNAWSSPLFTEPVAFYAMRKKQTGAAAMPDGLQPVASQGGWRIFRAEQPFVAHIDRFGDALQTRKLRTRSRPATAQGSERDYWLCSPLVKLPTATLELLSPQAEDIQLQGATQERTLTLRAGVPLRVTLALNQQFFTNPFVIWAKFPVQVRAINGNS